MSFGPRIAILAVLAVVYLGAMFLGTHLPIEWQVPVRGADKVVHALMFSGLAVLLLAAFNMIRPAGVAAAIGVVLLIAAYAAVDEWTQFLVPTRSGSPWDWAADVAGACLGASVFLLVRRTSRRSVSNG